MEIGSVLQQTREKMGYTLEEMAEITNIHIKYLQSLEQDQFDQLPSEFYVRIFLKNYAKRLGLDHESLVKTYDAYLKGETPREEVSSESSPSYHNHGFSLDQTRKKMVDLPDKKPNHLQTYFHSSLPGNARRTDSNPFPSLLSNVSSMRSSQLLPSLPKQGVQTRYSASLPTQKLEKDRNVQNSTELVKTSRMEVKANNSPKSNNPSLRSSYPLKGREGIQVRSAKRGSLPKPSSSMTSNIQPVNRSAYDVKQSSNTREIAPLTKYRERPQTVRERKVVEPVEFKPRSETHGSKKTNEANSWLVITIVLVLAAIGGTIYFLY